MSVTLREKKNKDTTTFYLDIYHNGRRYTEFLKEIKITNKPCNPIDRKNNKDNKLLAKQIRDKRAQELEASNYQITPNYKSKVDFLEYYQHFIDKYTKKDKRVITSSLFKFKEYLKDDGVKGLTISQVDETIVIRFKEYLENKLNGESPANYFSKFKKVLKQAIRDKLITINPTTDVTIKRKEAIKKEVLSIEEIQTLAKTPITNPEVKRAFLFSCFTGLRFCDIINLTWQNIDTKNNRLSILQSKTGHKATVNLHPNALQVLGKPKKPTEQVFTLPSHSACTKDVKHWVKKAEIEKHITWHCARHTFATNLMIHKADITTVSSLLGHTSLKYTQRYTKVVNELKREAIDNLPTIKI